MKSKLVALMIASGALAMSGAALAGDAAAGEGKAAMCMDCHEPSEDFAGLSADELAQGGENCLLLIVVGDL